MDKVSIIVPVYRVESYLPRTVDSLLGQTHENVEVILVDDGSPDGCGGICDEYALRDGRVVVIHQENAGVSAARNAGLDAAGGDWVAFCDGDDWFEPDMVEKLLVCAKEEQADYVICNYKIAADGHPDVVSGSVDGLHSGCDPRLIIAVGPIASWSHLIRADLFDRAGVRYPVGVGQYEELPVIPVLAKHAQRIGVVQEPLYNYYQRGDGSSASNAGAQTAKNFRIAHGQMVAALGADYEKEAEYHAIYALLYGEVLRLCKQKATAAAVGQAVSEFEKEFPGYRANPYLKQMGRAKGLFLQLAHLRWVAALRLLAWVHSRIVG